MHGTAGLVETPGEEVELDVGRFELRPASREEPDGATRHHQQAAALQHIPHTLDDAAWPAVVDLVDGDRARLAAVDDPTAQMVLKVFADSRQMMEYRDT